MANRCKWHSTILMALFTGSLACSNEPGSLSETQSGLDAQELAIIAQDGRSSIKVGEDVYSISEDNYLLKNGSRVKSWFNEMPFVKKIFAHQMPDSKSPKLFVWFYQPHRGTWTGHYGDLYVYDQDHWLTDWDQYQSIPRWDERNCKTLDITQFAVATGDTRLLALDSCGLLYYSVGAKLYRQGWFDRKKLPLKPTHFINSGDELFIVGQDPETNEYNKYQFVDLTKPALFKETISERNISIESSN